MRTMLRLFLAVMHLPTQVSQVIDIVGKVFRAITSSRFFPNPTPALAQLNSANNDLAAAEQAMNTRAPGTREARDEKEKKVRQLFRQVVTWVQGIADANPDQAEEIITSAGLKAEMVHGRTKSGFEVRQGKLSGEVTLIVKSAGHRASYEWQYSTDGKTWVTLPVTLQAKTAVRGLTPGTTYLFRFRAVTKAGEADWSPPVSFLVK